MKTLVIVGNAPMKSDLSDIINKMDCVVRFNNGKNYNQKTGKKTDILVLNSAGVPIGNETLTFLTKKRTKIDVEKELPYLVQAKEVWFPRRGIAPDPLSRKDIHDFGRIRNFIYNVLEQPGVKYSAFRTRVLHLFDIKRNLIAEIVDTQHIPKEKVKVASAEVVDRVKEQLRHFGASEGVVPSTGILGIDMILSDKAFDAYEKYIVGFEWKGWEGHSWQPEEKLVRSYVENGRLAFLEVL